MCKRTTSMLRREPIKDITRPARKKRYLIHIGTRYCYLVTYQRISNVPKNGRRNATHTVEMTNPVLRRIKHQILSEILTGSNSSILRANGFISKAYVHRFKEKKCRPWKIRYVVYFINENSMHAKGYFVKGLITCKNHTHVYEFQSIIHQLKKKKKNQKAQKYILLSIVPLWKKISWVAYLELSEIVCFDQTWEIPRLPCLHILQCI